MLNVDINVDRWTDGRTENRTPISHPATSKCDNKRIGTPLESVRNLTLILSVKIPVIGT